MNSLFMDSRIVGRPNTTNANTNTNTNTNTTTTVATSNTASL